jgi:hypothetical protein
MRKSKTFFLSSLFSIGLTISFLLTPGWLSNWFPNRAIATLPPPTQTSEFRAFWVDAFNPGFKTPHVEALAIKPRVKVTAATIAWGDGPKNDEAWYKTQPYREVLQDWRAWLEEGILDMVMPMTYQREYKPKQKLGYDNWIEYAKNHQYNRQIAIGPGNYLNYIEDTLAQIRRAEAPSATGNHVAGTVLYSYASSNVYTNGDLRSGGSGDLPRQPWKYVSQSKELLILQL